MAVHSKANSAVSLSPNADEDASRSVAESCPNRPIRHGRHWLLAVGSWSLVSLLPAQQSAPVEAVASAANAVRPDWSGPYREICCVRVSSTLVDNVLGRSIQVESAVSRAVLGVPVAGSAATKGALTVKLLPDPDNATFMLCFEGTSTANTNGRRGPVIIDSTACTRFRAMKQIDFDMDRGLSHKEAKISVNTQLTVTGLQTTADGLCGRLIRCVARRRIARQHQQFRAIAAHTARNRICSSLDEHVRWRAKSVNEALWVVEPLMRESREAFRQKWLLSTTEREFCAVLLSLDPSETGAVPNRSRPWEDRRSNTEDYLLDTWVHASWNETDYAGLVKALSASTQLRKILAGTGIAKRSEGDGVAEDQAEVAKATVQKFDDWTRIVFFDSPTNE